MSDLSNWSKVFYLAISLNTFGLIIFLIYGSAEPLFKCCKKSQAFDLDRMNDEKEDSLLLAKKQKLFSSNFNGINPAFKDDDDDT